MSDRTKILLIVYCIWAVIAILGQLYITINCDKYGPLDEGDKCATERTK